MIVRSGLAMTIPVMFSSGAPDGNVTWSLYNAAGVQIGNGSVAPSNGAVSVNLPVTALLNTLDAGSLYASRDLAWSYTTGGAVVNGEQRYSIEARAPFGASNDGVRSKLGVQANDLPDSEISLIRAYVSFRDTVGADVLAAVVDDTIVFAVQDAIEAQAAINLISTMAVRVAAQEGSGTNSYKRQLIDWASLSDDLSTIVNNGLSAVLPSYDPTPTGDIFIVVTPSTDPFTGDAYSTDDSNSGS